MITKKKKEFKVSLFFLKINILSEGKRISERNTL